MTKPKAGSHPAGGPPRGLRTRKRPPTIGGLRTLLAHIVDRYEAERSRLAREMHDDLGQMLMALRVDLDTASRLVKEGAGAAAILERLELAAQHLKLGAEPAKRISAELRPGVLDHFGLWAALEMEAHRFQSRTGIRCSLESSAETALPPARAILVFRMFQEMLARVQRHSRVSQVSSGARCSGGELILTVRHDGRPRAEKADAIEVLWMIESAARLGGAVHFESRAGTRASITLKAPLENTRPAKSGRRLAHRPERVVRHGPGSGQSS